MTNKEKSPVYFPSMLILASVKHKSKESIITLTWNGYVSFDPLVVAVSIQPPRFSYEIIRNSQEFVINIPTTQMVEKVKICGKESGRDVDKWRKCSFSKTASKKINTPSIEECPVNIECKVKEILDLGSHHLILADVVNIETDAKWIRENRYFLSYTKGDYKNIEVK